MTVQGPAPVARCVDGMNFALRCIAGVLMIAATVAISYQIIIRFVLTTFEIRVSAPWTEEIARYCFIWSAFLGAATLCRTNGLISVDYLAVVLPPKVSRLLQILVTLTCIGFFLLLAWVGWEWTAMSFFEASPVLRLPMAYVYGAMPVGGAIAALNLVMLLTEQLRQAAPEPRRLDTIPAE